MRGPARGSRLRPVDFRIAKTGDQWGPVLVDGDIVLLNDESDDQDERVEAVAQRCVYKFMTWLGESPYETQAGLPHDDILGSHEPIEGVVGLYALELGDVEGVSAIEDLSFTDPSQANGFQLSVAATARIEDTSVTVGVSIGS